MIVDSFVRQEKTIFSFVGGEKKNAHLCLRLDDHTYQIKLPIYEIQKPNENIVTALDIL